MMHLAYNHLRPVYSLTGGTLVTDVKAWSDRNPAAAVRCKWSYGAQVTSSTVAIHAAFAQTSVRCVALLNTTLPAGLKIELRGRRQGDTGYPYTLGAAALTQTLVDRIDGGTGAVWVLPASNDPLIGLEIKLYNDGGGQVALPAEHLFDIGEIVISGGVDFDIEADWLLGGTDPSRAARTQGSQIARVQRIPYRTLTATPAFGDDADARNAGLANGSDWQTLAHTLRTNPYVLAIARTATPTDIQTTSIYGTATRAPSIRHQAGPYYQPGDLEVEEIPGGTQ